MYFNEKEDTNIDKEFKTQKTSTFDKYKHLIIIISGVILLIIIIIIMVAIIGNNKYSLTLEGAEEITIYQGVAYIEPGYKAYDKNKNDVTDNVIVDGTVNKEVVGKYEITYKLNNKTKTRIVNVIAAPKQISYIHLNGADYIRIKLGETYEDPKCLAIDAIDGDITSKVTVNSNVDTSKVGIYRVVYSVVDSNGVTISATRRVEVE